MWFFDLPWFDRAAPAVQMPVGLEHVNSAHCWCEPLIGLHEDGSMEVVHQQVTWN
jgi:hypothetical protein